MRIEALYIDGYGIFRDFSLPPEGASDGFSSALTVVLGPNESGKSTLLSFIRTILFGFADARTSENRYLPLRGGRHGGRIFLASSRGDKYIVERFAGSRGGLLSVTLPDGSAGGVDDLNTLLGNASRELFRNVFAFSLSELQTFETLTSEGVRARIYSAGVGAGRLPLTEIEREIEQDRGDLFTERGSSQDIPKLFQEIDTLREKLRRLSDEVSQYDFLRRSLDSLTADIVARQEQLRGEHNRLAHIRNLIQAWDDWIELKLANERLGQLPEVDEFPSEGLIRLERFLDQERNLGENLTSIRESREQAQTKLAVIQVDERLLQEAPKIEALRRGLDRYESAKKDLPVRQAELRSMVQDLEESLRDIGPGWDGERIKASDTSLPAREAVRHHREALLAVGQVFHDAERETMNAKARLEEATKEHDRLDKTWKEMGEPLERDRDRLEERRHRARELLVTLSAYRDCLAKRQYLGERHADRESHLASIERQLQQGVTSLPIWPILVAVLMIVALGGWLIAKGDWAPAVGMVLVIGIITSVYLRIRTQLVRRAHEHTEGFQAEKEMICNQLRHLDEELEKASQQVASEETSLGRTSQELEFEAIPNEKDVESLAIRVEDALEELRVWEEAQRRVAEAHARVKEQEERVQRAEDIEKQALEKMLAAREEWRTWLEKGGIDPAITPDTCLELLSRIQSAREKLKAIETLRARIKTVETAMDGYEQSANEVLRACGQAEKPRSAFPIVIDELIDSFGKAQTDAQHMDQFRAVVEDATQREEQLQRRANELDGELTKLLSEAGAESEGEFRKLAEIYAEREKLLSTISERTRNLERVAGRGKALEGFLSEMESTTPEELDQREREGNESVSALQIELEERQKEWGRVDQQVRQLEAEDESSALRFRLCVLKEQLKSKAREWSVLTIAHALLREARAQYERERQPAVVQEAQEYFSRITRGRYSRLLSPPGENRIAIEDKHGQRKDVAQLSRGTAEQLYLALRFGLVQEFGRRAEPLPVVMDDVLANFDPQRARETCWAIERLAEKHQLVLFTCHPETVELLRSEIKGCKVIELSAVAE